MALYLILELPAGPVACGRVHVKSRDESGRAISYMLTETQKERRDSVPEWRIVSASTATAAKVATGTSILLSGVADV